MSLNHKEIDLILNELRLVSARIQTILQPSYDTLVLGLYTAEGQELNLLLSIATRSCRLHSVARLPPKSERPLRFMECLRAKIRDGRITGYGQLGNQRIVYFNIHAHGENFTLYARLWSGAANIVLTDEKGLIIDVLARKPKRGEVSGRPWEPPPFDTAAPVKEYQVREFPADLALSSTASFNEKIALVYAEQGTSISREELLTQLRELYGKKIRGLDKHLFELRAQEEKSLQAERLRELGDILLANQGQTLSSAYLECDDFFHNAKVMIAVDPKLTILANAQHYYEQAKKAHTGLSALRLEIADTENRRAALLAEQENLLKIEDSFVLAKALQKVQRQQSPLKKSRPGLSLVRGGFRILVGRTAKENDELLRRHAVGNDLWLHIRDYHGSFVFIKAQRNKTVPLPVLLDAASLAVYYSKGRSRGSAEVYYTHVKYLRRVKGGAAGQVIPTQEKNLHIDLDEEHLSTLKSCIE